MSTCTWSFSTMTMVVRNPHWGVTHPRLYYEKSTAGRGYHWDYYDSEIVWELSKRYKILMKRGILSSLVSLSVRFWLVLWVFVLLPFFLLLLFFVSDHVALFLSSTPRRKALPHRVTRQTRTITLYLIHQLENAQFSAPKRIWRLNWLKLTSLY